MVEDMEKDPLATDIPPHISFVNDCLCAKGTGTEDEEAMVEDMEEDPQATDILRMYYSSMTVCEPRAQVQRWRPWWRIWRRIHWPQIILRMYYLPMIVCVPRGRVQRR